MLEVISLFILQTDPGTPVVQFVGPDLTWVYAALGFVILVGGGLITLLATRKNDVHLTETRRADSNEKLVVVRDKQLADCEKDKAVVQEDLEAVTAEYKTLVGINIKELFNFWIIKEDTQAENANLRAEIRIYKKRLGED